MHKSLEVKQYLVTANAHQQREQKGAQHGVAALAVRVGARASLGVEGGGGLLLTGRRCRCGLGECALAAAAATPPAVATTTDQECFLSSLPSTYYVGEERA